MRLPNIAKYSGSQYSNEEKTIIEFKGYNAQVQPREGEFVEMTNLTSDNYPCLSPRGKREQMVLGYTDIKAFHTVNGVFCFINGSTFYYDDDAIGSVTGTYPKTFVNFQSKIIILPDKVYYDINEPLKGLQEIDSEYVSVDTGGITDLTFWGTDIGDHMIQSHEGTDFSTYFKAGDAIVITGCTYSPNNNKPCIIKRIDSNTMYFEPGTFEILVEGGQIAEPAPVTLSRKMPDMDFVCSHNNRMWGCKGNTIYSSKQGSLHNWHYYQGLSTDSWSVDVSSEGEFTGCIGFETSVMFFKENIIHKLYLASRPTSYQIVDINCRGLGLLVGCNKSLSVCNNTLFYKSRVGVVASTGGMPELISERFGDMNYLNAVACNDGRKYYISMKDTNSQYNLFVYDTEKGMWHREDDAHVVDFGYHNLQNMTIFFLDTTGSIWAMKDLGGVTEETVAWSATLAEISEYANEKKGYSKLNMRVDVDTGSTLNVDISTDGSAYKRIFSKTSIGKDSFYIPIVPTHCERFTIKLSGTGACKVYSLTRVFKYGSDMG